MFSQIYKCPTIEKHRWVGHLKVTHTPSEIKNWVFSTFSDTNSVTLQCILVSYSSLLPAFCEIIAAPCSATVTNLQQKLETVQTANTLMKEDLAIAKNTILELQQQNTQLCAEKDKIMSDFQKQIEVGFL